MKVLRASMRTALTALVIVVLPASLAVAKLTDEERLEMKKRVQKEIQKGEVPEIKPGMSFEERVYIRKKQQALEKEKQAQGTVPQPPAPAPPAPSSPPPRPEKEHTRKEHRPDYHSPSHRPFEYGYDRYPSHDHDWRRERCRRIWGGGGYEYHRCLNGEERYLYPERYEQRETTIILETPPPQAAPWVDPDRSSTLRAEHYPVWYGAEASGEAVVTAQDASGNVRSFHLVGVRPGNDADYTATCIDGKLGKGTVRINEVGSASDYADAEAVVFSDDLIVNRQVLAEGCAEFDERGCNDLDLEFCDAFRDAESVARRNRVGIWR